MTDPFSFVDRRATARTSSGIYTGGDAAMRNLRARGFSLPGSNVHARIEARKVVADVQSRGTATDIANRAAATEMRRQRLSSTRASVGGSVRTAANVQMAMPKIRQPMGSLIDKGIPFNVQDPKELIDLRRWCRLFAATHPLVPLLIDIYSTFPVTGLELTCKDPSIQEFYTSMFLDDLNYEEYLPEGLLREYFTVGEVTTLSHFNEELGTWASEEILNPDMVKVSKSLFVEEERVQLMVKEMVDALRDGNQGNDEESHSEKLERHYEYQMLVKHYPEIVKAAQQDDGLDISDALVSRLVNKAAWWDTRGTPHLLRSFRTLMMEESVHAAEDAVCDRMYAPMILATLGVPAGEMGGDDPWIPDQGELDELKDDLQAAMAADFKVMVHNMGLTVTSVFGREAVPDFSSDYDRIDAQLMQTWGIGQALIMGGTGGGGTYASTAINREVCEQLMKRAQNKVKRHMRKKMEIIAEAQEHYDYEIKGGVRKAIYREIEEYNEETGENEIVRVPKLLIPDVDFATLNLRDEQTERAFLAQLKELGVPISDGRLAVNCPIDFEQELETQADETYAKGMAQAQVMDKLQKRLDADGLAYPSELVQFLQATLQIRQLLAQTDMLESQNKMADQQLAQASPAGMLGLLPGTTMQPLAGVGMPGTMGAPPMAGGLPPGQGGDPAADPAAGASADPTLGAGAPAAVAPQQMAAAMHGPRMHPPVMAPPGGIPDTEDDGDMNREVPRNRARPPESDEMRAGAPKQAHKIVYAYDENGEIAHNEDGSEKWLVNRPLAAFERGPSSYGRRKTADFDRIDRAVARRERLASGKPRVEDLIKDPDFWSTVNMGAYKGEILADWPEIYAGGAPASRKILEEACEQYEEATGVSPRWP